MEHGESGERPPLRIHYQFDFDGSPGKSFEINLDSQTLELVTGDVSQKPEWAELGFHQCPNCPLSEEVKYCPIALNLSDLVQTFEDRVSYEQASITVTTKERVYSKRSTIQKGLSGMLGIYMVTSNCPIMDQLRPMVRFHLPFATPFESVYRTIAMYLIGQFLVSKGGEEADWDLDGLRDIYKDISVVNKGISQRLSAASRRDANMNALVILNSFGDSVPYVVENGLEDLKYIFSSYLKDHSNQDETENDKIV